MPAKIIDLDEVLGEPKRVKLKGKTYTLAPDLPVELYLKIIRFEQAGDAVDHDAIIALHQDVLDLFRYGDPTLESVPLSLPQLVTIVARVYGNMEADEAPPPKPTRGGAGASRSAQRTKSRR